MLGQQPIRATIVLATFVAGAIATSLVLRVPLQGDAATDVPTAKAPILISADFSHEWDRGATHIAVLRGHCKITHGAAVLQAQKMVVWQTKRNGHNRVAVYLEENSRLDLPTKTLAQPAQLINLVTQSHVTYKLRSRMTASGDGRDPLFRRASLRKNATRHINHRTTQPPILGSEETQNDQFQSIQVDPPSKDLRRIRFFRRYSGKQFDADFKHSTNTTPSEQVVVLTGGINLIIDGIKEFGTVDLLADRMVIWSQFDEDAKFDAEKFQSRETPLQVYLEGDIVIRQGEVITTADRAVFDARENRSLMLNAEIKTPLPQREDVWLRIRAERIRQESRKSFHAQNAWATTSRFGEPGYRFQASDIYLEQRYANSWLGIGSKKTDDDDLFVDPTTGALVREINWMTSLNNVFLVNNVPLFFAPYLSAPAEDPNIPLRNLTVEYDRIFGGQIRTTWNMHKLLGREASSDVLWDLHTDYLTHRGPAIGTGGEYRGSDAFGFQGSFSGNGLAYYIHDTGKDNLGRDRRGLEPNHHGRGQVFLQHRHEFPLQMTFLGEVGYLSDRNFLEQYFEDDFDDAKDYETLAYLQQSVDNMAWSVLVRPRLNDFSNTTEWYPRGDVYVLSEPLLGGRLLWTNHSYAGYGRIRPANAPNDPTDVFTPLPFLASVGGTVAMTRSELSLPFHVGAIKVVPYLMGEAAHWGESFGGGDLDRVVGVAGVRGSIMFSKVMPHIHSHVFNVNGLAHKMIFDADYSAIDTNQPLANVAQYNEFDDNAQERFRQRLVMNSFGGVLPGVVEPRFYAVRTGAGISSVTAPYHELVDRQQVIRFGWRNRLQTKVGPPDQLRIKNWMTLDMEASYFPKRDRDNFGEDLGLLSARYSWLVGDRTSLLADAYYDLFDDAQQLWNFGLLNQRSARGSVYLGVRQIKGAGMDSRIVTASASYAMSPKWITTIGTAYDFGENENRGQSITISRIGADFIVHFGANFDASKDNAGIAVSLEPRIGIFGDSSTQLSTLLGTNR